MTIPLEELAAELAGGHPETGAYDLNDELALAQINASNRIVPHETTNANVLYEALQANSITDLPAQLRSRWDAAIAPLFNLESFSARGNVLPQLETIFGGPGSPEVVNYIAATQDVVGRARELWGEDAKLGDIIMARSL